LWKLYSIIIHQILLLSFDIIYYIFAWNLLMTLEDYPVLRIYWFVNFIGWIMFCDVIGLAVIEFEVRKSSIIMYWYSIQRSAVLNNGRAWQFCYWYSILFAYLHSIFILFENLCQFRGLSLLKVKVERLRVVDLNKGHRHSISHDLKNSFLGQFIESNLIDLSRNHRRDNLII